jgi:hypothetical protein
VLNIPDLMTATKSFENVENFTYLEMTVTKQNKIHEEINSRLNPRKAYCHSV